MSRGSFLPYGSTGYRIAKRASAYPFSRPISKESPQELQDLAHRPPGAFPSRRSFSSLPQQRQQRQSGGGDQKNIPQQSVRSRGDIGHGDGDHHAPRHGGFTQPDRCQHVQRLPAASQNIIAAPLLTDIPGPERKIGKLAFSSYRGFFLYRARGVGKNPDASCSSVRVPLEDQAVHRGLAVRAEAEADVHPPHS